MQQATILTTAELDAVLDAAVERALNKFFSTYQFQHKNDEDEFVNVEGASAFINKAVPTIYDLVNKRLIPHYKRGKQLYFRRSELLAYIESGRRKTQAELAAEAETFNPKQIRRKSIITR